MTRRDRKKTTVLDTLGTSVHVRWALLVFILLIFALVLYPELGTRTDDYAVGDVVRTDIKATHDFLLGDEDATTALRRQAARGVVTVYDLNPKILKSAAGRVNEAFSRMRDLYREESEKPRPDPVAGASDEDPVSPDTASHLPEVSLAERMMTHRRLFESILGMEVSREVFSTLNAHEFSEEIVQLITTIVTQVLSTGVVANKEVLLQDSDVGIVLRNVETLAETRMINLKQFYSPDQAKTMVRVEADPLLKGKNAALVKGIVDLAQRLVQPNITLNSLETEARRDAVEQQIKPVVYLIKKGEMVLRDGERVTPLHLQKLEAMKERDSHYRVSVVGTGAIGLLAAILMIQYQVRVSQRMVANRYTNRDLLFLAVMMVTFIILVKAARALPPVWFMGFPLSRPEIPVGFGIPLAAGAMTVCLFMGLEIALVFATVVSLCAAILLQGGLETFTYYFLGSTMGAWWLKDCRERKVIIKAGTRLGLINAGLAIVIDLYTGTATPSVMIIDVAIAFFGGIGAGIITAGLAPGVEMVFDYATDITLMELSNLDSPILRRLMLEAPGTYHHSVVVGSLVEAAASEIGANPILGKVAGYYHDIGKLSKPLYFIENQEKGKNPHDKLAPSLSALILISHVKNGVEIARENKLGQAIINAIEQHHGTSLIQYFYEKAKTAQGEENISISDFRYPGPTPQTREAGLVMLADVVEAASRTLENPTPARIQGLVRNLMNKIFSDGQLDHCELTLKDLNLIAQSFNKILTGIHHHRIEYQEATASLTGKTKNGHSDRKPPDPPQPVGAHHPDSGQPHPHGTGSS
ncbi:HDIG domain-containing protein [Desulfosarcina sp. OttesenSCG-928-G10]|nr:HDIG domain-containing protein [Desulfosarcina sp. OttesenSCG-928-G10]